MTDPHIYELVINARLAAEESEIDKAETNYLAALRLLESKAESDKKNVTIEYLDIKAEWLVTVKVPIAIKNNGLTLARKLSIEALDLVHEGKQKSTEDMMIKHFLESETRILKKIISELSCLIPKNEAHFTLKCPILLKRYLGVNATSPTILYKKVLCSICLQPYIICSHERGHIYNEKAADLLHDEGKVLDLSLVSTPRDPRGKLLTYYIPLSYLERDLSSEQMSTLPKNGIYCHYCNSNKIDPIEITYEIFTAMQRPEPRIDVENNSDIKSLNSVVKGVDIRSAIGKPLYLFPSKERYSHIQSLSTLFRDFPFSESVTDNRKKQS